MRQLDELRTELTSLDEQILTLLEKRFALTDEVATIKNKTGAPLTDLKREQELLTHLKKQASHPALREYTDDIFTTIIQLNKTARVFNQSTALPFQRIGIIGLGMIGGSIVKAIKSKSPQTSVSTLKRDSVDNRYGVEHGYLNTEYDSVEELVDAVDLLILATPIEVTPGLAENIAACSNRRTDQSRRLIVIDVCSVKTSLGELFATLTSDTIEFLPTHPMAGSEKMGFAHAQGMMFVQKPWVICRHEQNTDETVDRIATFIEFLGSRVEYTSAEEHDHLVASVSHLVFMISTYLFAFCNEMTHSSLALAGSGFETTTRLASGNSAMHSQIYNYNEQHILEMIKAFQTFLDTRSINNETSRSFFDKQKQERDTYINQQIGQ